MLLSTALASDLFAQNAATEEEHPLVESVTFEGMSSLSKSELQRTLSTEATRCRIILLWPLCALTHSRFFEMRHRLNRDELKRDVLRTAVFYWLRGFRHVHVDTTVTPKGRGVEVTFNITEGPPTVVQSVTVDQPRQVLGENALRRWGLPREGDRMDMTRLDSLATRVRRVLWDRGHGNAMVTDSAHPVDSLHVALRVLLDAGPLTTVDTVLVEGNEDVTARTVRRLVGLHRGDLYKRLDLLEAQRRVYRSDLFRQSLLSVPDSADSVKTVLVTVREAPLRGIQLGVGFNTVEFGQLQGNFTLYNFHGSARRIEFQSVLGNLLASTFYGKFGSSSPTGADPDPDDAFLSPTWQVSLSMTQPWLFSTSNSIGLNVFTNRRSVPDIVVDRGTGGSATFTRALARDVPLSFTYRYERTSVEAGELYFCVNFGYCRPPTIQALQQTNSLSPFIITLRADRTDDPLAPRSGYSARVDLEHASEITGSDWRFNRGEIEVTPYFKIGRASLAIRMLAGRVTALSGTEEALGVSGSDGILLHPRTRFYAGGARSVRGYAEGQLGPRVLTIDPADLLEPSDTTLGIACTAASIADGSCDPNVAPSNEFTPRPVGGNTLLAGTIEYRFALGRTTGGAVFVDAARVSARNLGDLLQSRSAITPGIGFRYMSPIGPVRIDLGLRPKTIETLQVVTQTLSDDSTTLRLVELTTPKRYDQTEGPHGFLGNVFSRLQLHLYIGEAF